jgi:cell division protease FtsH
MLGGRAAERVIFDEVTTGAENDLRRVTNLAHRMVAQFGMSDAIGPLNFGDDERQPFLGYSLSQGRSYGEETANKIDAEVRRMVDEAYEKTVRLLSQNRDKLDALAEALMREEVIGRAEMMRAIGMEETQDAEDVNVFSGGSEGAPTPSSNNGDDDHATESESPAMPPVVQPPPPTETPPSLKTPPDGPNWP